MWEEKANLQSCSQTGCQSESQAEAQQDLSTQSHHAPLHPEKRKRQRNYSAAVLYGNSHCIEVRAKMIFPNQ